MPGSFQNGFACISSRFGKFAQMARGKLAGDERQMLKGQVWKAIRDCEIEMFLQFIVNGEDGRICGGEAVSRWMHPQKGMLCPGCYIALMESEGAIAELDFLMFEKVCRQLERWHSEGETLMLSCNFARPTIGRSDFVGRVREIAGRYAFARNHLVMEITEDAIEEDRAAAFANMAKCKEMGFTIALDDAGSGFTSLFDLLNYPADVVKLDSSLMRAALTERGRSMLRGLMEMLHGMGISVLCEGAETRAQVECIRNMGCDYIQGYYFYRPVSLEEANRILKRERALGAEVLLHRDETADGHLWRSGERTN